MNDPLAYHCIGEQVTLIFPSQHSSYRSNSLKTEVRYFHIKVHNRKRSN